MINGRMEAKGNGYSVICNRNYDKCRKFCSMELGVIWVSFLIRGSSYFKEVNSDVFEVTTRSDHPASRRKEEKKYERSTSPRVACTIMAEEE